MDGGDFRKLPEYAGNQVHLLLIGLSAQSHSERVRAITRFMDFTVQTRPTFYDVDVDTLFLGSHGWGSKNEAGGGGHPLPAPSGLGEGDVHDRSSGEGGRWSVQVPRAHAEVRGVSLTLQVGRTEACRVWCGSWRADPRTSVEHSFGM